MTRLRPGNAIGPLESGSPRPVGLASLGLVGWLYRNREALNGPEALPGKLADDLRTAGIRGRAQRCSSGTIGDSLAVFI